MALARDFFDSFVFHVAFLLQGDLVPSARTEEPITERTGRMEGGRFRRLERMATGVTGRVHLVRPCASACPENAHVFSGRQIPPRQKSEPRSLDSREEGN